MKFDFDHLPFNWFDIATVAFLIVGFTRGRKNGMSVEMMYMFKWIAIVAGSAYAYRPAGEWIAEQCPVSHLFSYILAYLLAALVIRTFFALIQRAVGGKLVGSSIFGSGEYYLGMLGGVVRFACIWIFFLSILHARHYTQEEIKANAKYQDQWFGSDLFPTIQTLQANVFQKSLLGPQIDHNLAIALIKPTEMENRGLKRSGEVDVKDLK